MGIVPPVRPVEHATAWAIGRVEAAAPLQATWSRPARITLVVEEVLRGAPPPRLELTLGPPIGSGQQYFYVTRHLGAPPWPPEVEADVARQRAQLDATPIDVPAVGARIAVGITQEPGGHWSIRSTDRMWVPESGLPALRAQLSGVPIAYVDHRAIRARRGLGLVVAGLVATIAFFTLGGHHHAPALLAVPALALAAAAVGAWWIARPG